MIEKATITIRTGSRGAESQSWAEMLWHMYLRWCERHGYQKEITEFQEKEVGIEYASIEVEGEGIRERLRSEDGVHRLVRISPHDSLGRRHTSFASVRVAPRDESDNRDAWERQIRSYVFHPYILVKDHQASIETTDIDAVLDGDIDRFHDEEL